jgi:stage II sporulation protein AA (anti-sigma F factor antagonist)
MGMNLSFRRGPQCLVARLVGELDLSSAPEFKERVERELRATGEPNLVLNLRGLEFVDSTGLGAILGRMRHITAGGGTMALASVPPKVLSMLEMAGLSSMLPIVRNEEEAFDLWLSAKHKDSEGGVLA